MATGVAVGLTRFEGGVACVWIAAAVLLAALSSFPVRHWPVAAVRLFRRVDVVVGTLGSRLASGSRDGDHQYRRTADRGSAAASLRVHRSGLESLRSLGLFLLAAGIVGPALTAFPGAALVTGFTGTALGINAVRWFIAHALGALTFTPVFALIASGELRRSLVTARRIEAAEAILLLGLVAMVSLAVFSQNSLPILFLPVLPLMVVTFRLGRIGAALASS